MRIGKIGGDEIERKAGVFWRPNPVFVKELGSYLKDKKVLEIFAGNGYLASLLIREGVEVRSTSLFSGHDATSIAGFHHPVEEAEAREAVLRLGSAHDVLMMSWPTVSHAALEAAILWGKDKDIVFIGEFSDEKKGMLGGCATDEFFERTRIVKVFETYKGNMLEKAAVLRLNSDF